MKNIILIISLTILLGSCTLKKESPTATQLFDVEKQFSDMSAESGMVAAFTHFCDEEAVLLRSNSYPIIGSTSLSSYLSNVNDSLVTLTWNPSQAVISESGELGYTYGIYQMSLKSDSLETSYGTYVTIWKKNKDGEWKFVLDTGQDGLE